MNYLHYVVDSNCIYALNYAVNATSIIYPRIIIFKKHLSKKIAIL